MCDSVFFSRVFKDLPADLGPRKTQSPFFSSQPFALTSVSAGQLVCFAGFARRLYRYLICVFVRLGFAFKKLLLNFSENRCAEVSVVRDAFLFVSKFRL